MKGLKMSESKYIEKLILNEFNTELDQELGDKVVEVAVNEATKSKSPPRLPSKPTDEDIKNKEVFPVSNNFIPVGSPGYVPFGHFGDVDRILKSKIFYPIFIQGLSGNGKTEMVKEICAKNKREMFRVNITAETDEDDLLGGFRLFQGETVWEDGPVINAMIRGAILLLDEVDLASTKIMCLQPVLEGNGIYLKKVNRFILPKRGFNIVATANTKGRGQGDEDSKFVGTNIMNEAFLERFAVCFEQDYPTTSTEEEILRKVLENNNIIEENFIKLLTRWAAKTRTANKEGAFSEVITTRRLVHICKAFAIFGKDKLKAINLCLSRFDSSTKKSLLEFYTMIDSDIRKENDMIMQEKLKKEELKRKEARDKKASAVTEMIMNTTTATAGTSKQNSVVLELNNLSSKLNSLDNSSKVPATTVIVPTTTVIPPTTANKVAMSNEEYRNQINRNRQEIFSPTQNSPRNDEKTHKYESKDDIPW